MSYGTSHVRPAIPRGQGLVTVRDYGAVGDGVHDDADAFEAAAAYEHGAKTVYVPPGTYYCSRDLHLNRATHLLGGANKGGNAYCKVVFAPGCGIRVNAAGTAPVGVLNAQGQGSIIEGLWLEGQAPAMRGRWTPRMPYARGDKVHMIRPYAFDPSKIQGMRFFYWECVEPGISGDVRPDLQHPDFPSGWGAWLATFEGIHTVWRAGTFYSTGQVVRRRGDYGRVFVATNAGTSGAGPAWSEAIGAFTYDGEVKWQTEDGSLYYYREGLESPVWAARVHSAVKMHLLASVRDCSMTGWMNAAVSAMADDGLYPAVNVIGWNVRDCSFGDCGAGIVARGNKAHLGSARDNVFGTIGYAVGGGPIDWDPAVDSGGNGGIVCLDQSYFGCVWENNDCEGSSDRHSVADGRHQENGFWNCGWDEASPAGSYFGTQALIGTWHGNIDQRSLGARVSFKDFRQVEQQDFTSKRQTRIMLSEQGQDRLFSFESNRVVQSRPADNMIAYGFVEYPTVYRVSGEWQRNYARVFPYYSLFDGFHAEGLGWRDVFGHFRGDPRRGSWYLGEDPAMERASEIRRGLRIVGDRFEPRIDALFAHARGGYLGRVVTAAGFRGGDAWPLGAGMVVHQFSDLNGFPPTTVEYKGHAFVCTRTGYTAGVAAGTDMDNAITARAGGLSPTFQAMEIVSTWQKLAPQQLGMIKRSTERIDDGTGPKYRLFRCTARDPAAGSYASTGSPEPDWSTALPVGAVYPDDGAITWTSLGPDPDDAMVVRDGTAEWTCVGPLPNVDVYGPIYEKATLTTNDVGPIEGYTLDRYVLDEGTNHFDVVVTAYHDHPTAFAGMSFVLRAAWVRRGSEVRPMGSPAIDARGAAPWMASLVQRDSEVRVRVSGAASTTILWASTRQPR